MTFLNLLWNITTYNTGLRTELLNVGGYTFATSLLWYFKFFTNTTSFNLYNNNVSFSLLHIAYRERNFVFSESNNVLSVHFVSLSDSCNFYFQDPWSPSACYVMWDLIQTLSDDSSLKKNTKVEVKVHMQILNQLKM